MVQLTATQAAEAAIHEYCELNSNVEAAASESVSQRSERLRLVRSGGPVEHLDLIEVSKCLVQHCADNDGNVTAKKWRLDALLKGATVFKPPPPPKPEQSTEYKALMRRLRLEEEQRQYERMINRAPPKESFSQRFPTSRNVFEPMLSHGASDDSAVDEITLQDINRQVTLIINVLVTVIASSVTIWFAARYWPVPQRLALAFTGSIVIAVAEVVIYLGYLRRIEDAKGSEKKKIETKQVAETWVIEKAQSKPLSASQDGIRYRRGKHR